MKKIACPFCKESSFPYERREGFTSECKCGGHIKVTQIATEEELSMFNRTAIPKLDSIKMSTIVFYKNGYCSMESGERMIPIYSPWITELEEQYAIDAIKSRWIGSQNGKYIADFEKEFAEYIGVKHCITTNNGTAACHLTLDALGIGDGDEVIVPALTFVATINAVSYTRAKPIIVDVDEKTWNIDCHKLESALTSRTKAIFCVHLYGNPCDIGFLRTFCDKHNLYFIEDACEAISSTWDNKKLGSFGDVSAFSFYANKIITSGEGGAVVTNNNKWRDVATSLRGQGQSFERYFHDIIGYNYRLNNISAAIVLAQLRRIKEILKEKTRVYETYRSELSNNQNIKWQQLMSNKAYSCNWIVNVLVEDRDKVFKAFKEADIDYRPIFYPLCDLPPYKNQKNMPIARDIHEHGVSLSSYPTLKDEQIKMICKIIGDNT